MKNTCNQLECQETTGSSNGESRGMASSSLVEMQRGRARETFLTVGENGEFDSPNLWRRTFPRGVELKAHGTPTPFAFTTTTTTITSGEQTKNEGYLNLFYCVTLHFAKYLNYLVCCSLEWEDGKKSVGNLVV